MCPPQPVRASFSGARRPSPRPRQRSDRTAARVRQRSVLRESVCGRHPRRRARSPSCRRGLGKATEASRFGWARILTRSPRQGTLVVNDKSVELSEAAAPCAFTVGSNTGVVGAEGGTLTIDVRTNAACSWTASTDAPWATPSPESGKGTQTVRVAVAPNSGSERSARATIANQQLAFSQRGAAPVPPPPAPAPAPAPAPPPPPVPTPSPTPTPPAPVLPLRHRQLQCPRRLRRPLRRRQLRDHRAPTPAPTPKAVTLSGTVTSSSGECPTVTYVIKGRTVVTTAATDFQKGSCSSIKAGRDVQVEGVELVDGTIRADVVIRQ